MSENEVLTAAKMEADRIARFDKMTPNSQMFVDTDLPGHARDMFSVIGPGVSEDPNTRPTIAESSDFNIAYVGAEPGNGAALHDHKSVEVFIPFSGQWTIYWGDDGEHEIELGPMDCISIPPGVMRGFRNSGSEYAHLCGIVGGSDNGKVSWADSVLEKARANGLRLDEDGNLIVDAAE
jgi:mannose-6-phosphate isomerase-like protein (cupin superfamily)